MRDNSEFPTETKVDFNVQLCKNRRQICLLGEREKMEVAATGEARKQEV